MAWDSYFTYGGREVINAARARAYARGMGLSVVRSTGTKVDIAALVGDAPYVDPVTDGAPWYAPNDPASADFAGVIPVSVSGIENSSRSANGFNYTGDGGNPGALRHQMKEAVFSVVLVGKSDCAVESGFRWLKRTLMARQCVTSRPSLCFGEDLAYFSCEPDGGSWATDYYRYLRNVVVVGGPSITGKRTIKGCGSTVWTVQWTVRAGDPFEYSAPVQVLEALGPIGSDTDPYAPGFTGDFGEDTFTVAPCPVPVYSPIFDPNCPALVTPPGPPILQIGCYEPMEGEWKRSYAEIPASAIPLWDEARPVITIEGDPIEATRNVRVAFYSKDFDPEEGCDHLVGEFRISYIPADAQMVIDAVANRVYIDDGSGYLRSADSLVLGGDNTPINWFGLSCNEEYYVTLDQDDDAVAEPVLSLSLAGRTA